MDIGHRAAVFSATIALAALLGGCGSTEPPPTTAPPPTTPPPARAPQLVAWDAVPRVIGQTPNEPVRLLAWVTGDPVAILFSAREVIRATPMALSPDPAIDGGPRLFEAQVMSADLLRAIVPTRGGNFIGVVKAVGPNTADTIQMPVNMVVASGLVMPEITRVGDTLQISDHVINIRKPMSSGALEQTAEWQSTAAGTGLDAVGVDPDFAVLVPPVYRVGQGVWYYRAVRNEVQGIGVGLFDHTSSSAFAALRHTQRLRGIVTVRDPALADLGSRHAVHEFAHAFAAYLSAVYGVGSGAHWPISELANGIMGYQRGTESEMLGYRFERQGTGTYVMRKSVVPDAFNGMELYLLGLNPASVPDSFLVFSDPANLPSPAEGVEVRAPAAYITIGTVIERLGPRVPSFSEARSEFRAVLIVVTAGRLLTPTEMAWYEYAATRGEATERLPAVEVTSTLQTAPWYVATGGRGQLVTRVR
jgi:hypothetical protein